MSEYGGIAKVMPVFSTFFLIITFSSIAVPGTNGFVGEFLVLLGAFKSKLPLMFGVLAGTAVILGAAYMLWMVQRVFFGPLANPENQGLKDLNKRELVTAIPFVALVLVMGLKPQPFLDVLEPSTHRYVARALWASDEKHLDEGAVRVQVRSNPANGPLALSPTVALPAMPTLRQLPPRIMQAPVPVTP